MPVVRILTLVLSFWVATGQADEAAVEQKNRELEQVRGRITTMESQRQETKTERDTLVEALKQKELLIAETASQLDTIKTALQEKTASLEQLKQRKSVRRADLNAYRRSLAKHMRAIYILHRQDYLKMLLNAEEPAAIGRGLSYHSYYNRLRARRVNIVTLELKGLDNSAQAVQLETEQLRQLQTEQQNKLKDYEQFRRDRQSLVVRLDERIASQEQRLKELYEDERRLEQLIRSLGGIPKPGSKPNSLAEEGTFGQRQGQLTWPAQGQIVQTFGARKKHGAATKGVLIAAPAGTEVHAISDGEVIFADWFRHMGLLVILDHADGYMSLYGHNQLLRVKKGDAVKLGDTIAAMGDSGGNQQSGLYFEIRFQGKAVNPARWCGSKNK